MSVRTHLRGGRHAVRPVKHFEKRELEDLSERRGNIDPNWMPAGLVLGNGALIAPNRGRHGGLGQALFLTRFAEVTMHGAQICA